MSDIELNLRTDIIRLEGAIDRWKQSWNSLYRDKQKLEQQLEELKKDSLALADFYGNRFSWNFSEHPEHEYYAGAIKDDDSLLKYKEKNGDEFEDYCGGKRARQFLAKYRR